MKQNLLKLGMICLMLVFSFIAKAQDVTATWDFQHNLPEGILSTNIQKGEGDVASNVEGISLHVNATTGKLQGRTNNGDAQFNEEAIIQVPVKSAKDIVTVTSYPNYHNYTVGGAAATADATEHKATTAEVAKGYVEIIGTSTSYLYNIKVVHVSAIQEKALYTTDFTNWTSVDRKKATNEVVNLKTLYSKETFSFTLNGVGISPADTKFTDHTGFMQLAKYPGEYSAAEPSAITSPLASITKITLHQAATGGNRGIKVSVKGDGDEDWVVLHNKSIATSAGEDLTIEVNRTNCKIKFENFTLDLNAYVTDLAIYGNVDMSKTPMLGSFSLNGNKYQAADIFNEDASGKQLATILVSKKSSLISEANPLTNITADNGTIKSTTYTTTGEGAAQKTVVSMVVEANGDQVTYELTVGFKPDFTLTYYNTDGTTKLGTQSVEQDAKIVAFKEGMEDQVIVADGKKFRGWSSSLKADEKKYTVDDVIKSDVNLYALVTDIETANPTARYDYNLQKEGFCSDDHEAFNPEGSGKWYKEQHGWVFSAGDKVKLLMGGKGYIKMNLCQYSASANITLSDPQGNEVATIDAKAEKDGALGILQNPSTESGEYTLTFAGTTYLHSLSIVNLKESPYTQNGNWYTLKAGDAQSFITTLETVNGANAATDAPRSYIFLPNGTYDLGEACLTTISGNNISIIGESIDKTIIVNKPETEGIGNTATLFNTSSNLYLQDLTLNNAYPFDASKTGRAVCLQDKGTRTICKNVRMLSFQDTYYSNNNSGQYYFENAEIHGIVDFICGGGDAFFNKCDLVLEAGKAAYITASYTDGSNYGYVFDGCKVIGTPNSSFTFGRAWGGTAKCAFLNTILDKTAAAKIASTRWTPAGMNVIAKNLYEYNTTDEDGNVISPAENKVKFTLNTNVNEYNTILTSAQAAEYTLDKVFTDWTPAALASQKDPIAAKVANGKLTWTGNANMYMIEKNGEFVALTTETEHTIDDASAEYEVRAANEMGGFGLSESTATGIDKVISSDDAVKTVIYSVDGMQLSHLQKGINILVKTFADGSKKTSKVIVK